MKWNQIIPEFDVFSLEKSLQFYINLIGFKLVYERKEDNFAFLQLEDVQIMLQQINKDNNKWETGPLKYPLGIGINFQIDVSNIDKIYNNLKNEDYRIFADIENHWYRKDDVLLGCREFLVQDPNGYLLRFSEDLGEKQLNTKD